jgi:hypothetical protein
MMSGADAEDDPITPRARDQSPATSAQESRQGDLASEMSGVELQGDSTSQDSSESEPDYGNSQMGDDDRLNQWSPELEPNEDPDFIPDLEDDETRNYVFNRS